VPALTAERRRLLRRLGRALLLLGAAWLSAAILIHALRSPNRFAWIRRATQPHWMTYRDGRGDFQIDHLSHWQEMRPMERFTFRHVGPVTAMDRIAFRYHDPFAFASVASYQSKQPLAEEAWFRLALSVPELASSFGEQNRRARPVLLPGELHALEVRAEGPVRGRTFRFRSLFFARGDTAYRVTVGSDVRDWNRIDDVLDLMLASFRAPALPHARASALLPGVPAATPPLALPTIDVERGPRLTPRGVPDTI
jgi:hypothetical protein